LLFATGDLDDITKKAWTAVAKANDPPELFLHHDDIVRLGLGPAGEPSLVPLDVDRMRHALCEKIAWTRLGKNGPVSAFPHQDLVRNILVSPSPGLPRLRRIVRAPVFASDGRLLSAPGFDESSGILHVPFGGFSLAPIRTKPTAKMVADARKFICQELLADFPFVLDGDVNSNLAHAVALLLLPFGRDLYEGSAPLHMVEAPTPGTGKGLLVHALASPALGKTPPMMPEVGNEDEWRKRLTAVLRSDPELIVLDNLSKKIDSPSLAALLTTGVWEDRVLGRSQILKLTVDSLFVATGNNPSYSTEMVRRTLRIRIDAQQDRPHLRDGFRHEDLLGWTLEHRSEIVRAALVLWQAWLAEDRPRGGAVRGSFQPWADALGGVLAVAGIDGFLANDAQVYDEADEESVMWRALVLRVWSILGQERWNSASDIADQAAATDMFSFRSESGAAASMGRRLVKQRGRYFNDLRFESRRGDHGALVWRLQIRPSAAFPEVVNPADFDPDMALVNGNQAEIEAQKADAASETSVFNPVP